ncbi:MAG: Fic family protein [Oscillospiraceae bacterium]|nr:Fic family protein [Christensenellales bacterium]
MDEYAQIVRLWQQYAIRAEADIDLRLDSFRVLFAYHSGKIENPEISYHDTREIFENGRVVNFTGSPRTIFEQRNQKLCYDFLKPRIIARKPITIALIKETHAILTAGTYDETRYIQQGERPGAFKKHDYVTGIEEVGSLPEDVEHDMQELLATLQELAGKDPLKTATYFHVRFEYIHPFADGNGRVGRTLLNYLLMTRDHPPLIVYDEDKRDYYAALEQYDRNEDYQPMYAFLKKETIRTWEKALERDRQRTQREK